MTTIGFVGLGTMGRPMAGHIFSRLPQGDVMVLNDITSERVQNLTDSRGGLGLHRARTRCPRGRRLLHGPRRALRASRPRRTGWSVGRCGERELLLVVCSTVAPDAVRQLDADVSEQTGGRVRVIDAPVSGGQIGAEAGTLSIMVGGPDDLVEKAMPYLSLTGNPVHLGPTGAGEVAKACNQLVCAANIVANAEAAVVAERAGLDVGKLFELMLGGYASSKIMADKGPRYVNKDYSVSSGGLLDRGPAGLPRQAGRTAGTATVQGDRLLEAFQAWSTRAGAGTTRRSCRSTSRNRSSTLTDSMVSRQADVP